MSRRRRGARGSPATLPPPPLQLQAREATAQAKLDGQLGDAAALEGEIETLTAERVEGVRAGVRSELATPPLTP